MDQSPSNDALPSRWRRYEPTADAPWNMRRVVHLHRRAGFAATWAQLRRDLAEGPEAAVTRALSGDARLQRPPEQFEQIADQIGDAAVIAGSPERLKAWWFYRMLFTPDPLGERLALVWHNHFATGNQKVADVGMMRRQNDIFRALGRAPFQELLSAVLHDPAVLVWLDAPSNRRGRPNENLARELMELFTLGAGNFTESDVKEAARALTGWHVRDGQFLKCPEWHDDGEKTILGRKGNFDGDNLLRILTEHPAAARRLVWRLCATFMGENVADASAIEELAIGLRRHDLNIGWAIETILRSNLFFAEANIGTQIVDPAPFMIGTIRALGLLDPPPSTLVLAEWIRRIGQDLFYPPNVGGWPGGRTWLTTRTIVARANFANALVRGDLGPSAAPPDLWPAARDAGRGSDLPQAVAFYNDLLLAGRVAAPVLEGIVKRARSVAQNDAALREAVASLLAQPEAQLV